MSVLMRVKTSGREAMLEERLHDRLERIRELRCPEHHQSVVSVTLESLENGWFDCRWITCCEDLENRAADIIGKRS